MQARGVFVDHSTVHRWAIKMLPVMAAVFRRRKRSVGLSWRMDKSGADTAAIESVKADACVDILMRQNKFLNNIVEKDHRAIKRITRPMLGFKSF